MIKHLRTKRTGARLGDKKSPPFILLYTLIFAGVFALTYHYFLLVGKTMAWNEDGISQHINSLMYLGKWVREVLGDLFFKGSFNVATYSFSLGYGGDIIQILHYYAFGDPLDLISVAVPCKYTIVLYHILIVLRLYLAGLAFSKLCFFFNANRPKAVVLAGAITYVFGGYALMSASKHPYFINPMIYFPIVIIGVEKIFQKKTAFVFVIGVFLSAVSNLYFFYMIVFMTVLYVIIKLITARRQLSFKDGLFFVLKLGCYSVLAVVMSAAVLLPIILQYFSDPRAGAQSHIDILYPITYYKDYLNQFLSIEGTNKYWLYIGATGLSLPALFTMFIRKRQRSLLKIGFIVLTIFSLLPVFGKIINVMTYPYNRWLWAYSLLISYIIVDTAEDLTRLSKRQYVYFGGAILVYFLLCVFSDLSFSDSAVTQLLIAVFVVFAAFGLANSGKNKLVSYRAGSLIILTAAVVGVGFSAYFGLSPEKTNFFANYHDAKHLDEKFNYNEATLLEREYNGGFYRYTGTELFENVALQHNISTSQFFYSLSNPNVFEMFNELDVNVPIGQFYDGPDMRAAINTLTNVKYSVSTEIKTTESGKIKNKAKWLVPYGFDRKGELWAFNDEGKLFSDEQAKLLEDDSLISKYIVHKNKNFLPFGYTYSNYISKNEYKKLSSIERQEAMLQSVVLDKDLDDVEKGNPVFTSKKVDCEMVPKEKRTAVTDNSIVALKKKAKLEIDFDGMEKCETYLYIKGLNFKNFAELDLYNNDKSIDPYDEYTDEDWEALSATKQRAIKTDAKNYEEMRTSLINITAKGKQCSATKTSMNFYSPTYKYYEGKHDFLVNLGFSAKAKDKIILEFRDRGIYSFDKIEVYCQPMNSFEKQVKTLKEDTMKNLSFHKLKNSGATNEITGDISLKENKILLLGVPYSNGWTAYVDGKETEILRANTAFSALKLSKGDHTIRLTYDTPGFKIGVLLSALGVFAFVVLIVVEIIKRKRAAAKP